MMAPSAVGPPVETPITTTFGGPARRGKDASGSLARERAAGSARAGASPGQAKELPDLRDEICSQAQPWTVQRADIGGLGDVVVGAECQRFEGHAAPRSVSVLNMTTRTAG